MLADLRRLMRFNPRARGGRDRLGFHPQRNGSVSIHAPAGGATLAIQRRIDRHAVSIHAPAGGATRAGMTYGPITGVSIHAPAGGATRAGMTYGPITGVSIHAPAGGATHAGRITFQAQRVSIHAPAGGATCPVATWRSSLHRFQSTRPRGARLSHHNSLIRRTVPAPLREPNACCQQRQTSKVSPGTNTLSINRLDMREPIRQSMSTWGSPQTGRPAECGMGQMVPRRSADHGSRRTALHRYARPYVASSGPGNRSEGCQPQGQSTPATDP